MKEFEKFAVKGCGISSTTLHDYRAYINPTILEERQLNVTQMDVFSRLMMERILFLGTAIDSDIANIIQAQILFLESTDPTKDIQIYVNSPGGGVYAGLGIYDTMQLAQCDVSTICTGMAASMGAVLLSAGAAGKRSALPHSRVMIHQPLGGAKGQATEIEITARHILATKDKMNRLMAQNTGQPYEVIAADTERDNWKTAQEALDYGLIDRIIENHASLENQ